MRELAKNCIIFSDVVKALNGLIRGKSEEGDWQCLNVIS
jgi:hypothetical protein